MAVDLLNTKFSDIDLDFVKHYLRIEPTMTDDDIELTLIIDTAKSFVLETSQLLLADLDVNKSANIIYLRMISELYHNRTATGADKLDPIFEFMLKNLRNYTNYFGTPPATTVI